MRNRSTILLAALLLSSFCLQAQWLQIGHDIDGDMAADLFGTAVDMSADGSIVAVGASGHAPSGQVKVFENMNGVWTQIGQDIEGQMAGDFAGSAISLSADGSIVAVSSRYNDEGAENAGQVRVFQNQNGNWTQIGQNINGTMMGSTIGNSLSLSADGSILAIGSVSGNGPFIGQVLVFHYVSGNWIQMGQALSAQSDNQAFGHAVNLNADGTILAVGAVWNMDVAVNSGEVKVFQFTNGAWTQIGQDINGLNMEDFLGYAISLSDDGTIMAIGAPGNNGPTVNHIGYAKIFEFSNNSWTQIGQDIEGEAMGDQFGLAMSISADGTIVAIGGLSNDGNGTDSGYTRIYQNQSGNWVQIGADIDGEAAGDFSGNAVSLSADGSILAIGALANDGNGMQAGHVRVYGNVVLDIANISPADISIYPNPTNGQVTLTFPEAMTPQIYIADLTGKIIYQQLNTETGSTQIDFSRFENGVYFVQFQSGESWITSKVIKQ